MSKLNQTRQFIPAIVIYFDEDDSKVAELSLYGQPLEPSSAEVKKSINPFDDAYLALCERILENGVKSEDRTNVGTLSIFGEHLKFDLRLGFPILTTKKINLRHAINELLFLYSDKCNNVNNLPEESRFLWQPWADKEGNLGSIYGMNVREWYNGECEGSPCYIDQLDNVINNIKTNPYSRRHLITNWNVSDLSDMSLEPCHGNIVQFYVRNNELSCQMYQRSADICIGLPFNIIHYAALIHIIAQCTSLKVGDLNICLGDAHIYLNHIDGIKEQLTREAFPAPQIKINADKTNFDDFTVDDFELVNYQSHTFIKFEIAV